MSFHEGPKCLDEGPKCLFQKGPKCPIGAEVVAAEVVGAEVSKIRKGYLMTNKQGKTYMLNRNLRWPVGIISVAFEKKKLYKKKYTWHLSQTYVIMEKKTLNDFKLNVNFFFK